jgi:hypothetical protein
MDPNGGTMKSLPDARPATAKRCTVNTIPIARKRTPSISGT